jgi:hypothetical protein
LIICNPGYEGEGEGEDEDTNGSVLVSDPDALGCHPLEAGSVHIREGKGRQGRKEGKGRAPALKHPTHIIRDIGKQVKSLSKHDENTRLLTCLFIIHSIRNIFF